MPDFRVVINGAQIDVPREVSVNTSLDAPLSDAQFTSETPLYERLNQVSGRTTQIYIDEELVFTGNVDKLETVVDTGSGTSYSMSLRSLSRNFMDSHISNEPNQKMAYENLRLGALLNLTVRHQGFPSSYTVEGFDNKGAQERVASFQWSNGERIGDKFLTLCQEHGSVLTDGADGFLRILNADDFGSSDNDFNLTSLGSMRVNVDLTRRYTKFTGYGSSNTQNNPSAPSDTFYYFVRLASDGLPRNFSKRYTTVQSDYELRRAVLYDAFRRQYNGLSVDLEIPGLVVIRKGTHTTLSLPQEEARGLAINAWVVSSVSWSKSVADGSKTSVKLVPVEQFQTLDQADLTNSRVVDAGFARSAGNFRDAYNNTLGVLVGDL